MIPPAAPSHGDVSCDVFFPTKIHFPAGNSLARECFTSSHLVLWDVLSKSSWDKSGVSMNPGGNSAEEGPRVFLRFQQHLLREKLSRELGKELGVHPGWLGMDTNSYLGQFVGDEAAPASHSSQGWDFWGFSQFSKTNP